MTKSKRKTLRRWTAEDIRTLKKMAKEKKPGRVIAKTLKRTLAALYMKASQEGIPLKSPRTPVRRKRRT